VENHEATNRYPARDHSAAERRKCSSDSHGSNETKMSCRERERAWQQD
jgi:hypothetical protein